MPVKLIAGIIVVVVLVFGVTCAVSALSGLFSPTSAPEASQDEANGSTDQVEETEETTDDTDPDAPASTPKDEWEQGTVPELFQTDPAWADEPYAGGTIEENGCGITCMAMVYIALTGNTDMGPVEMAEFSEEHGYVEDGGTSWRFMTDGGAQLGLTVETLPNVASRITDELESGHPIIVNVRPGIFTDVGHYIVLVGVDDDGRVLIHNPNAPEDDEISWDLETIMNEARNYWAFSV